MKASKTHQKGCMSVNVILTSVLFNNKSTGNHTRVSNNEHFLFSTEFVRLVTRTVKLFDKRNI